MNTLSTALPFVLAYGGVLLVGLALIGAAIVSLLRSFTPGSQAPTTEHARPRVGRATLYALGLGATAGGAVGLLALLVFDVKPGTSVVWALASGLVAGALAEVVLMLLAGRQQVEDAGVALHADGRVARVVIAIPPGGVGEVVYQDKDGDVHLGACSVDGAAIPLQTPVRIERVSRRVAVVRPLAETPAVRSA